ncbi:MAG: hypothetical protein ACYTGH_15675 [Planctomycetota bacterium]|jgi:hypothetical protein
MDMIYPQSAHLFNIPVMGTGFTVDSPLHVARYGISSVIAMVDDLLIEQMRQYHSEQNGIAFEPIRQSDDDHRARRVTAYFNLLDQLISQQVSALQASPFEEGSEITRYFDLLPEGELKRRYEAMLAMEAGAERTALENELRAQAVPGTIDVNIMTKMDRDGYQGSTKLEPEFSDAMSALRGYAQSTVASNIIFSAGMNPRLYGYAAQFDDFFPNEAGELKKKIVLKVTDYRSALIQGKYLAKRGLWVSEFRIESGLNCGGHAFATQGNLMGPVLEQFKQNRAELMASLHKIYAKAIGKRDASIDCTEPREMRITVQGGIGTATEQAFLQEYYQVDGTGWGTPFLLVPEATNVDEDHLQMLAAAGKEDVYLSTSSPLDVRFWSLRNSTSEKQRLERIESGTPGSPCPKRHAAMNSEFTEVPICPSSREYQTKKLEALDAASELTDRARTYLKEYALTKACICHELAGGVLKKCGISNEIKVAICPGLSITDFSQIATLEEMVGHIYGRLSLLTNGDRQHMFVRELTLYVENLKEELALISEELSTKSKDYYATFKENLLEGIEYYQKIASAFIAEEQGRFIEGLNSLQKEIEEIRIECAQPSAG